MSGRPGRERRTWQGGMPQIAFVVNCPCPAAAPLLDWVACCKRIMTLPLLQVHVEAVRAFMEAAPNRKLVRLVQQAALIAGMFSL